MDLKLNSQVRSSRPRRCLGSEFRIASPLDVHGHTNYQGIIDHFPSKAGFIETAALVVSEPTFYLASKTSALDVLPSALVKVI